MILGFLPQHHNNVKVKDIDSFKGSTNFEISLGDYVGSLTDDQKKEDYYIEYRTKAPADAAAGTTVTETNSASYTDGETSGGSGEITVNGTVKDWDVTKSLINSDTDTLDKDGLIYEHWASKVTIPNGSLAEFTYEDTIGEVKDDSGSDQHYATAADLEEYFSKQQNYMSGLYLKVGDQEWYNYNGANNSVTKYASGSVTGTEDVSIRVLYYDADGKEVSATDSAKHVKKFKVTVTPKEGATVTAKELVLSDYRTVLDTNTQKEGATWTARNTGEVGKHSNDASETYKKPYTFVKGVYTGKTNDQVAIFQEGDAAVNYTWASDNYPEHSSSLADGELLYQLMLHTTAGNIGTITITDTLPAGMEYVKDSIQATFWSSYWDQRNSNGNTDFTSNAKPTVDAIKNEDGTTTLTITISNYQYSAYLPDVSVTYKASVAEDSAWKNAQTTQRTYKNKAEWNGHSSSDNVTVNKEKTILAKSGVQQQDENGTIPKVHYSIVINAPGDDLDPNSTTLSLVDQMDSTLSPQMDLSSVHLYNYDSSKEGNKGTELVSTAYTLTYDSNKKEMKLTVPDSKPLLLEYDYNIDSSNASDTSISNSVSLNGKWSQTNQTKIAAQSSSATAVQKEFKIYKVDSKNYRQTLAGAEFSLESYQYDTSTNTGTWTSEKTTGLTTDSDGTISFNLSGKNPELEANVLYKITETKAPDGYSLDQTPYYIIWKKSGESDDDAFNQSHASSANKAGTTQTVQKPDINFFVNDGGVLYVPNDYTRIGVVKSWTKADGSAAEAPDGTQVQVKLYRSTPDGVKIHVKYIDGWNKQNDSGTYYVKKGGNFEFTIQAGAAPSVTYGNDSGTMTRINNTNEYSFTIGNVVENLEVVITANKDVWISTFNCEYTKTTDINKEKAVEVGTATLNKKDGWSYSWDNLKKTDTDGTPLYYQVIETGVTQNGTDISSNYITTYSNNDGIQSGQIVITNQQKKQPDSYKLPETGGPGTWIYRLLGMAIVTAGVGILTFKRRRKQNL